MSMIQMRRKIVGTIERKRERVKNRDRERVKQRGREEQRNVCTQEATFILVLHRQWSAN